ncbi:hypothetical protein CDAR_606111 [Caerostris darwini]|uniref:Uncharacterized protein n=1 Tax=Caerostris darwini TaxID=1538125 RepID=A0AAV4NT55_9ARAC|nr:hypothetical protein CDAR_606111 [Caerostris darwini]
MSTRYRDKTVPPTLPALLVLILWRCLKREVLEAVVELSHILSELMRVIMHLELFYFRLLDQMNTHLNMQAERNYSTTERETYAVIQDIKKFLGLVQDVRMAGSSCGIRPSTFEIASDLKISNR